MYFGVEIFAGEWEIDFIIDGLEFCLVPVIELYTSKIIKKIIKWCRSGSKFPSQYFATDFFLITGDF